MTVTHCVPYALLQYKRKNTLRFIHQIYDDLPDFIAVPAELKHSKAEVIILPLESENHQQALIKQEKSSLKSMLAELTAINEIG